MMFGAGIGIGMLTFATAEPIYHFGNNPDVIQGFATAEKPGAMCARLQMVFPPLGIFGLGLLCACRAGAGAFQPLARPAGDHTVGLTPLFGNALCGPLGHAVDIMSVIATILGVSVTIGYGVSQFASGIYNITGADWMMTADGAPTLFAQLLALAIVMGASTLSALSGVGRGIKWLSNINMGLSLFLLAFFIRSARFSSRSAFVGLWDYILALVPMSLTVWTADGSQHGEALAGWQGGWTIFYWAWWIAFAPFVGLFLARISQGTQPS